MHRRAHLAGRWYPADARACRTAIEGHSAATPVPGSWHGMIAPHAGWFYSGDAAGIAYRSLAHARPDPDVVVIFGSHRGPSGPNTVFRGTAWATPLGPLPTDVRTARALADLTDEPTSPSRPDNAVEVHLPFIKHFWPEAELLMVGVAADEPVATSIGQRVAALLGARDAVFVGSTDLTHYGPNYAFSPHGGGPEAVRWVREVNDQAFLDALLADDPVGLVDHANAHHSACCPGAVAATMAAVRDHAGELRPEVVAHYLSYDVRPDSSYVGYASALL